MSTKISHYTVLGYNLSWTMLQWNTSELDVILLPPTSFVTKGLILLNPADVTSHSSIVSRKIHTDFPSKFFHDPVLPSLPGVLKACYRIIATV